MITTTETTSGAATNYVSDTVSQTLDSTSNIYTTPNITTPNITIGDRQSYIFGNSDTWNPSTTEAPREKNMATICKRHENRKYWYEISVDPSDRVQYRVFYKKWYRRFLRNIGNNSPFTNYWFPRDFVNWKLVSTRSTLEATIGAAYLEIDGYVKSDAETMEHTKNIKEILKKANAEGMRMISELEKLENGPPEGEEFTAGEALSASGLNAARTWGQSVTTQTKMDTEQTKMDTEMQTAISDSMNKRFNEMEIKILLDGSGVVPKNEKIK